ncbi:MAG: porin family protein [Bacteroidota bacterium]
MKKALLFLMLIIGGAFSGAHAQIGLGIKGGLNISDCAGEGCEDLSKSLARLSFHVGIVGSTIINRRLSFQAELLYSTQGVRLESFFLDGLLIDEAIFRNDYITIPLAIKFYPISGLYLCAGTQLGYLIQSELEIKSQGTSISEDVRDDFSNLDIGLIGGLGYDFRNGFALEARYVAGITSIFGSDGSVGRNTNIQISIGYRIIKNRN